MLITEPIQKLLNKQWPSGKSAVLPIRGPWFGSISLGGSNVDSAFHPSKVDQMSTGNSWGLSGQNLNVSSWESSHVQNMINPGKPLFHPI